MAKLMPLAVIAVAALGACSSNPPPASGGPAAPNAGIVTHVHPYYAGSGVVQSIVPAPAMAAAGGSAEPMQRLEIKMDDGRIQYVDTASRELAKGTRVVLTEDRLIRKL